MSALSGDLLLHLHFERKGFFMIRILITGISGFLGWNLAHRLSRESDIEIVGLHGRNTPPEGVESHQVDIEKPADLRAIVASIDPDVVLHTAAISGGGDCEADPDRAQRINVGSVQAMLQVLRPSKTHLIVCSTDLVFDGTRPPYREKDMRVPRHVYARTKCQMEREVLAWKGRGTVARMALMYGSGSPSSPSFLGWLDGGLRGEKGVTLFHDEYRTPLYGADAAEGLLAIVRHETKGIYHLGGPERLSREAFARVYAEVFALDPTRIHSASQADVKTAIYRAPDVSFDISKACENLDFNPRNVREALENLRGVSGGSGATRP